MFKRVRLLGILLDCDFRMKETDIWRSYRKSANFQGEPGDGEAYLFVSKGQDQLIWFFGITEMESTEEHEEGEHVRAKDLEVADSRRWRIEGGGLWDTSMLHGYAEAVGLHLLGINTFEKARAGLSLAREPAVVAA